MGGMRGVCFGVCMLWIWWFESRAGHWVGVKGDLFVVVVFRGRGMSTHLIFWYIHVYNDSSPHNRQDILVWGESHSTPPPVRPVSVCSVLMSPIPLADQPPHGQTHNSPSREGRYYITTASSPARLHRLSERPTMANRSSNTSWTRAMPLPMSLCGSSMTEH